VADNFTLMSTLYPLKKEQYERAAAVMGPAIIAWLKASDLDAFIDEEAPLNSSFSTRIVFNEDGSGIWFAHDESSDPDLVAEIISALQKEFKAKETFVFSYCYTCSRARVGEFGGGAYAVLPDGKILHCDPENLVSGRANTILLKRKNARWRKKK
jgi:hypothetical protein